MRKSGGMDRRRRGPGGKSVLRISEVLNPPLDGSFERTGKKAKWAIRKLSQKMKTVVSLLWPINLDVHAEIAALCATVMSNITMPQHRMMHC